MEQLFFGYSSNPQILRETINSVAASMSEHPSVSSSISWEDLRVDGRIIINEVESAIDSCTLGLFELSTMNSNVLFELGLAIGKAKRVAILLDSQDSNANKLWHQFGILSTTGYTPYRNSDELKANISRLVSESGPPILEDLLRQLDAAPQENRLLYIPSAKEDEASRQLSKVLDAYEKFQIRTLDFADFGLAPLAVYVDEIYRCRYAVFHLTPDRAYLAEIMNPRISLLAGLARGLGRKIVLITEAQETPLDYRDLAISYASAKQLQKAANAWMLNLQDPAVQGSARLTRHISTELASLRFGSHVAEGDQDLDDYFVETSDYNDILNASASIFTGRKGTGKTANMLQAAAALGSDARNLVCVIKPASYELEALLSVLTRLDSRHLSDFLIEALWKYLIYTEVATRAVDEAEARPAGIAHGSPLDALRATLQGEHLGVEASFSIRLERLVGSLEGLFEDGVDENSIERSRKEISHALYGGTLHELRAQIGAALTGRNRIAILIDNLDKAWERGANLDMLAKLLLGLLTVVGRIVDEFQRDTPTKQRVNITLTTFLRSDIFAYIREKAREPDKINVTEIEWRDPNLLVRVIEDRFVASRPSGATAEELWTEYFVATVKGMSARDYILSRVQPRPRDLVFIANAIVLRAGNTKHSRVQESDVLDAEKDYSQFAYEALLVEGVASSLDLEAILIEFAGEPSIISSEALHELLSVVVTGKETDHLVSTLRRLGFLGIEVTAGRFDYGGTGGEIKRSDVLSRKLEKATGQKSRFEIHPAYRAYLGIYEG